MVWEQEGGGCTGAQGLRCWCLLLCGVGSCARWDLGDTLPSHFSAMACPTASGAGDGRTMSFIDVSKELVSR